MIAVAGSVAYRHGVRGDFSLTADPGMELCVDSEASNQ